MEEMKKCILLGALLGVLALGCKEDKPKEQPPVEKEMTILEKVAWAHGFANWKDVASIAFTFNVDRDSTHFERSWRWEPKSNTVTYMTHQDTLSYQRSALDSVLAKTDAGFINDKYWLLAPFQLVWDQKSFSHKHEAAATAPISGDTMQKLTIVYGDEGGYTPGDAYDLYFGDDFILQEWVFRKGNQTEPSMATTWEAYETKKGLKMATMHKRPDSNFSLYFDGISVE
jgi:hypothetical protein